MHAMWWRDQSQAPQVDTCLVLFLVRRQQDSKQQPVNKPVSVVHNASSG